MEINHNGTLLMQNYPNPFSESTLFSYQLTESSIVTLIIYNISGQEVRTLVNKRQIAGKHSVVWDGKNEHGENMYSGIYFCNLNIDDKSVSTKKIMLLK